MSNEKPKTILLVFLHGFKGDDTTFARFPSGISHALSHRLNAHESSSTREFEDDADFNVLPIVYPAFETRGSLQATVERFRAWLLEKVIDAEIARETEHPTLEPGVGVVLVGHSMGGIVGSDAILGTAAECFDIPLARPDSEDDDQKSGSTNDQSQQQTKEDPLNANLMEAAQVPLPPEDDSTQPIDVEGEAVGLGSTAEQLSEEKEAETAARKEKQDSEDANVKGRLFPRILGLLAFDTPYLGIAPGVLKHNAEAQFQQGKQYYDSASTLFAAGSTISNVFGIGGNKKKEQAAAASAAQSAAQSTGWGRTALLAGTGIATLAGGAAAAYAGRDRIMSSWNWASSHLEFVGCLAKEADLKKRFGNMVRLSVPGDVSGEAGKEDIDPKDPANELRVLDNKERKETVGFKVLYTLLAPALGDATNDTGGRTFCRVPGEKKEWADYWMRAANNKVKNEIDAHTSMFLPEENPQYEVMVELSADLIQEWIGAWQ